MSALFLYKLQGLKSHFDNPYKTWRSMCMCKVLKGRRIENTSEVTRDDKGHRWIKINILIDFIVKQIDIKC